MTVSHATPELPNLGTEHQKCAGFSAQHLVVARGEPGIFPCWEERLWFLTVDWKMPPILCGVCVCDQWLLPRLQQCVPSPSCRRGPFIHSFVSSSWSMLVGTCLLVNRIGEETCRDKVNVYFKVTWLPRHLHYTTHLSPANWKKKKKRKQNLEVENDVLFSGLAEDLSPGGSLSGSSKGLLWRGEWGASIYRNFCNKNQIAATLKDYC